VSCAQADAVVRQVWKVRPTSRYVLIRRTAPTRGAGTWVCGVSLQHQPGTARRPASTSGFGACALGLHEPGYRQLVQTGTDLLWAGPINS
jgi:hypothetical protein